MPEHNDGPKTPLQRAADMLTDSDWHYDGCWESDNIKDYCDCTDRLVEELVDLIGALV